MRRSAELIIFSAAFLLINLTSCKPRKAIEFRKTIVQQERVAFKILTDTSGPEIQKLEHLIKNDFKTALALLDKEEKAFNKLINQIQALPADGIKQGNELKTAAVNYYVALKELQLFDRADIANREVMLNSKGEALQAAQHKVLELGLRKQEMYKKMYEKERAFHQALEKFNTVHGI